MSRKKNVEQEYLQGDVPAPTEHQKIAMSLGTRGGNTVEVQFEDGSTTLCLIPSKFNKKLWIRKNGLVIVEETVLEDTPSKVTGTIVHVLYADQLKSLRKQGVQIPEFEGCSEVKRGDVERVGGDEAERQLDDDDGSVSSLPDVHVNPNRVHMQQYSDEDSD